MLLSDLVNPKHLQVDNVEEAGRAYREDHFGSVVLDDFLSPSFASGLLSYFEKDGEFKVHHSLKRADRPGRVGANANEQAVSKEVFDASPEELLLARELLMTGNPSANQDSVGFRAHRQLLELITSKALQKYLGAIVGTVGLRDTTYMARTMRFGDMCTAHSDAGDGRNLCMLLYIGDNWQPDFGGRFQNVVEGGVARSTDPIGNRIILHRPETGQVHQVEPIQEKGREWLRHSYSIWFGIFPPVVLAAGPSCSG